LTERLAIGKLARLPKSVTARAEEVLGCSKRASRAARSRGSPTICHCSAPPAAAQSKGLAAEQAPLPWWMGICSEKPRFGADLMAAIACKLLMLRDSRAPIPCAAEQRNKSGEQGEKSG
jgi:hypothetical protein